MAQNDTVHDCNTKRRNDLHLKRYQTATRKSNQIQRKPTVEPTPKRVKANPVSPFFQASIKGLYAQQFKLYVNISILLSAAVICELHDIIHDCLLLNDGISNIVTYSI